MAKLVRYFLGATLLLCASAFPQENRNALLTVDESKISFHLLPETGLDFPLFNYSDHLLRGTIRLELLDFVFTSKVMGEQVRTFEVTPGAHVSSAEWSPNLQTPSLMDLDFYRLHYTVTPQREGDFESVQGIVQL